MHGARQTTLQVNPALGGRVFSAIQRGDKMSNRSAILATGLVLWVLGVLVGASAGEILPGEFSVPAKVLLAVALLASLGNFAVLFKKAQR